MLSRWKLKNKKNNYKFILILIIFLSIYFCINLYLKEFPLEVKEEGTIEICFTIQENCEIKISEKIEESFESKAAFYDLNHPNIIQALKNKDSEVLIFDKEYSNYGIPVKSKGLMHDKFILLHGSKNTIITGSANPTLNDYEKNDNNILIIQSNMLFNNYLSEFEELKLNKNQEKTKNPKLKLSEVSIKNYFCPEDECENKVLLEIEKAKESIYFMTFSFTSDALGKKIIDKKNQIEIKGLFDKSQVASNKEYSEYHIMKTENISVKIKESSGKLHHKVFIIDKKIVITGSYNPTLNGNTLNDENILIIESEEIANQYLNEFERIWNLS